MKKAILYSFVASLFFLSCHKEVKTPAPITPTGKTYKVKFKVADFTQTTTPLSNGKKLTVNAEDSSDNDALSILYYIVYDSQYKIVHIKSATTDSASFPYISDNLPAGAYNIFFFAGKTGLKLDSTNARIYYQAAGDSLGNWRDTFTQFLGLNVTSDFTQTITLNRLVSAIRVNINDAIPVNAAKIVTTIVSDYQYYTYATFAQPYVTGFTSAYTKTLTTVITSSLIGVKNFQQYSIVGIPNGSFISSPTNVFITCYDALNNVIGSVTVPQIPLQSNKETIISGKLFGSGSAGNGFNISVNNTWDPTLYRTISF